MSCAEDPPAGPRTHSRVRRLVRLAVRLTVVGLVLFAAFLAWVALTCFAEPPVVERPAGITDRVVETGADGREHFGTCWIERHPGRSLLYLDGDPYARGFAQGRLTSDWMAIGEERLIGLAREKLPGPVFWSTALLVVVNNRSLPSFVKPEYQQEILGIAEGSADPLPDFGPRYHRILNYHAAHDISHWVMDRPTIGCTAFAARGAATVDGHLLVGRNFDFEAGSHFDEQKLVMLCRPTDGLAFLSVAWSGMAGAVTGINAARIYCSINGARSSDLGRIGTPVSLVVRDVLQHATTLDEAIAIVRDAQVFVSDSYLLADGKTGDVAVVEKTPARAAVRRIDGDTLVQSNHFLTPELADDEGNREQMHVGTTVARHERLAALLVERAGTIDPAVGVAMLRDRNAVDGQPLAPGNRATLAAMIATHSVLVDVTDGVVWVSAGPHELGDYAPFAIDGFGVPGATGRPTIPADPALADGTWDAVQAVRATIAEVTAELARDGLPSAASMQKLEAARTRLPRCPDLLEVHAQALAAAGRPADALATYRDARDAGPAFAMQRDAIDAAIETLTAGGSSGR